jgi:hypothetical protein
MKIGMSLGKCLRDIVTGVVAFDDVIMIVARTDVTSLEGMLRVVDAYMHDFSRLYGLDEQLCKDTVTKLWNTGKIHQPRNFGPFMLSVRDEYVWMDLVPTQNEMTPVVKDAWDNYRMLLTLGSENVIPEQPERL